jgi:hypothetical protein
MKLDYGIGLLFPVHRILILVYLLFMFSRYVPDPGIDPDLENDPDPEQLNSSPKAESSNFAGLPILI